MSTAQTLLLGAIAGLTIFVGLPMGRVHNTSPKVRAALSSIATGILVFLFWDVVSHGVEPVESHLEAHKWGAFAGYATLLSLGFTAGLMSLVYYDGWLKKKRSTPLVGPGAAAIDEFEHRSWLESLTPGRQLALLIATGIGLHNFGEGLAIGQSAAAGELSLALVLIIGFGLHNMTEGFGIIGPMTGEAERPSWGFLGLMGLIGGGPTFLGTADRPGVGQPFARGRVLRGRRRLDPLRGHPALRGLPAVRDAGARRLVAPARAAARVRHRLGPGRRRGLNYPRAPVGAFFHAVAVFVHHLRQVEWAPLGLALACHVAKLLFRGACVAEHHPRRVSR